MNERFRQLAEQAEKTYTWKDFSPDGYEVTKQEKTVDLEKFAELIVRECAEVAHCNFHVDGVTLGNIMKERFGVEE